jgi:hypothetical protein
MQKRLMSNGRVRTAGQGWLQQKGLPLLFTVARNAVVLLMVRLLVLMNGTAVLTVGKLLTRMENVLIADIALVLILNSTHLHESFIIQNHLQSSFLKKIL